MLSGKANANRGTARHLHLQRLAQGQLHAVYSQSCFSAQRAETAAHSAMPFHTITHYGRGGIFGAGVGAELDTYAAVTSSRAFQGSLPATGPFSVKSINISVAGE